MSSRAVPSNHVEDEGADSRMAGPEPKRPRMAFEGDVDMPDAATLECAAWAR